MAVPPRAGSQHAKLRWVSVKRKGRATAAGERKALFATVASDTAPIVRRVFRGRGIPPPDARANRSISAEDAMSIAINDAKTQHRCILLNIDARNKFLFRISKSSQIEGLTEHSRNAAGRTRLIDNERGAGQRC
jgi:hypothetical protein